MYARNNRTTAGTGGLLGGTTSLLAQPQQTALNVESLTSYQSRRNTLGGALSRKPATIPSTTSAPPLKTSMSAPAQATPLRRTRGIVEPADSGFEASSTALESILNDK